MIDAQHKERMEDSKFLRYMAASLTYNDTTVEAEAKHRLYEIAMRIDTNYYYPSEDKNAMKAEIARLTGALEKKFEHLFPVKAHKLSNTGDKNDGHR